MPEPRCQAIVERRVGLDLDDHCRRRAVYRYGPTFLCCAQHARVYDGLIPGWRLERLRDLGVSR